MSGINSDISIGTSVEEIRNPQCDEFKKLNDLI
jgi:hypothetical protein